MKPGDLVRIRYERQTTYPGDWREAKPDKIGCVVANVPDELDGIEGEGWVRVMWTNDHTSLERIRGLDMVTACK